jgi:hypothetical protein
MADAPAETLTNPLGQSHEGRLLDDLKQLDAGARDKSVIRLHLSRLQPDNRNAQGLRSAETAFEEMTSGRCSS